VINTSIRNKAKVDEENPYWISFSDIMAGLLVIFILAALQLILQLTQQQENVDEKIKEIEQANKIRSELLAEVKDALEEQGIKVEISDNDTVLRIPSATLAFVSDQSYIPVNQQAVVEKIGIALLGAITTSDRGQFIDTIFVEGHTDSLLSKYKGVGNWLLSSDRAISIWRYWGSLDTTSLLWELRNFRDELMFSVSGYAETRRVEKDDNTPELRKKNRRIDLRFTMKQPTTCDYEAVLGNTTCSNSRP